MRFRLLGATASAGAAFLALGAVGASAHFVGAGHPTSRAVAATHSHLSTGAHATRAAHLDPTLAAPVCVVSKGPAGDANVVVGTIWTANGPGTVPAPNPSGQLPADQQDLDLRAAGFTTDATAGTLTATFLVTNLNDGPNGPTVIGDGNVYEMTWTGPDGKTYFLWAEYMREGEFGVPPTATPGGANVFFYGHIPAGGFETNDGKATGSFDPTHNTITVTAPLTKLNLSVGDTLAKANAYSNEDVFTGYTNVDLGMSNTAPYNVGDAC